MGPEVDQAAAPRQRALREPRLVGTVGVVEGEIGRVHPPQFTVPQQRPHRLHRREMAVGQVDAQQSVGGARGVDHRPRFGQITPQRLLAEDRHAVSQDLQRLLGVQRAGRGDHDPVEVHRQQLREVTDPGRCREPRFTASARLAGSGSATATTSARPVAARACIRLAPIQPTPTKPKRGRRTAGGSTVAGARGRPRSRHHQRLHESIRDERRAVSIASSSCSNENRWVYSGAGSSRPSATAAAASRIPSRYTAGSRS